MIRCDEDWLALADAFGAAALGAGEWLDALSGLAEGTGSRAGELIGLGSDRTVPFNWVSDLGPDWMEAFIAAGGGDPEVNPFVRVGSQLPELTVLASGDFLSPEERRRNAFLSEHTARYDIPYICLAPLLKERSTLVGLAVMRSSGQGEIEPAQRAMFASIAPHVRAAVRTQMALENRGAELIAGALEALSLAVFVCDRRGAVKALTPAAERLVSAGDGLQLKGGVLGSAQAAETRILADAIAAAAGGLQRPGAPVASTLAIHGRLPSPLVVETLPLPRREFAFGFEARALVVVRGAAADEDRRRAVLASAYRLTGAEVEIAVQLGQGRTAQDIAAARAVSIGTVRSQIKSVLAKLGVSRQAELVARVTQL